MRGISSETCYPDSSFTSEAYDSDVGPALGYKPQRIDKTWFLCPSSATPSPPTTSSSRPFSNSPVSSDGGSPLEKYPTKFEKRRQKDSENILSPVEVVQKPPKTCQKTIQELIHAMEEIGRTLTPHDQQSHAGNLHVLRFMGYRRRHSSPFDFQLETHGENPNRPNSRRILSLEREAVRMLGHSSKFRREKQLMEARDSGEPLSAKAANIIPNLPAIAYPRHKPAQLPQLRSTLQEKLPSKVKVDHQHPTNLPLRYAPRKFSREKASNNFGLGSNKTEMEIDLEHLEALQFPPLRISRNGEMNPAFRLRHK